MLPLWQTVEELPAEKVLPALQREGVPLMKHHEKKKHGHPDRLVVLFQPDSQQLFERTLDAQRVLYQFAILGVKITMQLLTTDTTKGLNLTIQEILAATGQVFPSSGPFKVDAQDPNNTVSITPGSDDQTTPTNFKANGSNATGTVSVTVTDTSNGLVGTASFDVVAPAAKADTLVVGFVAAS